MRKILIISILLAYCSLVNAVTLDEAVKIALENRGDVESFRNELNSTTWDRRNAGLWFLPSVNANLNFIRSYDVQVIEVAGMGSIPMGSEYASYAGISVDMPLFIAQGPAGYRLSVEVENLSISQLASAEQDAVLDVIKAFYGVLLAREMVMVSEEALAIAEEGFEVAEVRFEAGIISRFELLQSEVAWENRKPDEIAARSRLQNAKAGFAVALGLSDDVFVKPDGSLETDPLLILPETYEEAFEIMLNNNPDLVTSTIMEEMGNAQVSMASAAFYPSLILQTGFNYQAMREDWRFNTDDYERNLSASVMLQIPLFNGINDIAGYNSARADRLAAQANARSLRQATSLFLIQAWNSLQEAGESVEATSYTLRQAQESTEIAIVSYEAGTITRLDMDQAFLALTSARTNYASALYHLRIAEGNVARAMGVLTETAVCRESPGYFPQMQTDIPDDFESRSRS